MEIADLKSFLVIARHLNLRMAAVELNQSPSALSKALRRLEQSLNTHLFDRNNKTLRLNADGERLRDRAGLMVRLSEQTEAEFRGSRTLLICRVAAPAVLQWRFGSTLTQLLVHRYPESRLAFSTMFEDAAIVAVARGEADIGFVTGVAVAANLPTGLEAVPLVAITMQLAAAVSHPLVRQSSHAEGVGLVSTLDKVLPHDFACPNRSMFCGIERGSRADGWRDDRLPRRIRYWVEDLQVLMSLIRSGHALAYLPDFALREPGLVRVKLSDCPYECVESTHLIWRPSAASGWHRYIADSLPAIVQTSTAA
ncbi:MAG TPA: LysR family transcriptional regulator [Xanthomonadaceae bacterium]|jgi:DNA-binding transcriptional LysR family regulator|nr:LysR family transcriptional regulator [Xanthomonadaceae bacterium]